MPKNSSNNLSKKKLVKKLVKKTCQKTGQKKLAKKVVKKGCGHTFMATVSVVAICTARLTLPNPPEPIVSLTKYLFLISYQSSCPVILEMWQMRKNSGLKKNEKSSYLEWLEWNTQFFLAPNRPKKACVRWKLELYILIEIQKKNPKLGRIVISINFFSSDTRFFVFKLLLEKNAIVLKIFPPKMTFQNLTTGNSVY